MTLLLALALVASSPAPLTVPVGENWVFAIDHGQPAHALKVAEKAKPAKGEIKISVRALFGTMMTATNNSATGYTFKAELIGADGKAAPARTCTLPSDHQPTLESWPQKAAAVRIGDFKPAKGGRC